LVKRLCISLVTIASGLILLGALAHTFDGGPKVPASVAADSLSEKCYLALSPSPLLFGMDFRTNNVFEVSICDPAGTYEIESEFLIVTFWNATACASSAGRVTFDGILLASALHFFRAEGPSIDTQGIAFRVSCDLLP
jgi:hypothetical protein